MGGPGWSPKRRVKKNGKGVVYIQIIRASRSLCVIIEANDVLIFYKIQKKIVWTLETFHQEPKYAYALFSCVLRFYVFYRNIFHTFDIYMLQMPFTHEDTLKRLCL